MMDTRLSTKGNAAEHFTHEQIGRGAAVMLTGQAHRDWQQK